MGQGEGEAMPSHFQNATAVPQVSKVFNVNT